MSTNQPRELPRLFKTPNNQAQTHHHRYRTPDTVASNVSNSTEDTDSSPADIILHLSNTDHAETMSSAELRTRTGGQIFLTKPVDVFQPTGKPRARRAENSEDSWLCRPTGGLSVRARTNAGAVTPTRVAMRRGVLRDGGPDKGRRPLGGVAEDGEGEEGNESIDLFETPDGEYTGSVEFYREADDLDGDVLMEDA
ncbi:hypothetical protein L873DRAFT_1788082 [Choiromyces venosus 120613-1]|uniref:Uncharacterized protein n=1 Tax=Choiromyces venosus 120613-1 TaxID=1336337 RepID=A0A3N4JTS2_9PEZI|nr:hypothetical protein L873DRAFT_1788082 [Choiromyces venosus 120613-1]